MTSAPQQGLEVWGEPAEAGSETECSHCATSFPQELQLCLQGLPRPVVPRVMVSSCTVSLAGEEV